MIDSEGYRLNVGIILCNQQGRLFWGRRIGQRSWQFPQGGIQRDESPEQAMFRELAEEVGLRPEHVRVIGCTKGWLRYRLPKHLIRQTSKHTCIGQKQVWFLLRMLGEENAVRLDSSEHPEFDHWEWVDYWYPLQAVVSFKRHVYWQALRELAPLALEGYQSSRIATVAGNAKTAFRKPEREKPQPREKYRPPLGAHPLSAVVSTSVVRRSEADRTGDDACQPAILPLRRMETAHHPVITRMVVSIRRLDPADSTLLAPPAEHSTAVAALENLLPSRSTVAGSHR